MVYVFDQRLLDMRRRRALERTVPGADFLLRAAVSDLIERVAVVRRSFAVAVDLSTPTPLLSETLAGTGRVERVVRLDRVDRAPNAAIPRIAADPEALPLGPATIDLAVSALALQWVDDLPGLLAQVRRALRPDGLFLAVMLGGDTLHELRTALAAAEADIRGGASPRVSPFADVRELGTLLQRAGLTLPVADQDRLVVRYEDALCLMRDLRAMGAANAVLDRDRRPLTRAIILRAAAVYAERFADPDGRVRATFQLVSLSGWAPHESQQQPLQPGSARNRLADALGAREFPAGEKPGA